MPATTSPLVSVVIPTYNAPHLLLETLATVFAQTFADFEVVVIDDGSTDDTAAQLARISDQRLRVLRQANQGIGAARNRGLDEARGKHVAFLDHDDLWLPRKLAVQVEFMERNPECVACSVPWKTTDSHVVNPTNLASHRDARHVLHDALDTQHRSGWMMTTSALMVRREAIGSVRFLEERNCIEDVPFYIGVMLRGPVGLPGDKPLMLYRIHGGSFSKRADYFYNGIRMLRAMRHNRKFPTQTPAQERALDGYLAAIARGAMMFQLLGGYRRRGVDLWRREFPHLLREGRYKLLIGYPFLLLLPQAVIRRRWKQQVI